MKKADIDETKGYKKPPGGVLLTCEVLCHMFELKPNKINDPDNPGKKILDYYGKAKQTLLADAKALIDQLS